MILITADGDDRNKIVLRGAAVAAIIGTFGVTGAAIATADTLVELDPATDAGAHCLVIGDDGSEQSLYSSFRCEEARADIDEQNRRQERRDDRREERREERRQNS